MSESGRLAVGRAADGPGADMKRPAAEQFDTSPGGREAHAAAGRPLALCAARKVVAQYPAAGAYYEDVVAECWLGVLLAARLYKPGPVRWAYYAVYLARQAGVKYAARFVCRKGGLVCGRGRSAPPRPTAVGLDSGAVARWLTRSKG